MSKEIFVVWNMDSEYEFFSTKAKAYARCVDIINEVMCDDPEEQEECLLELAEYAMATDVCGWYMDYIDPYGDDEDETDSTEPILSIDCIDKWKEPRPMKYHIYNTRYDNEPFTINGKVLEFDNYESANRFVCMLERYITDFKASDYYIREDKVYSPYGYMDATTIWISK